MNVFVYGTLLVPEIWKAVTGSPQIRTEDAVLPGFRIERVIGGDFPGIVPDPTQAAGVPGRVILNVSDTAVRRLDRYESDLYDRLVVDAILSTNDTVKAHAYVVPEHNADVLSGEQWNLEWFMENAFKDYWNRHFAG